MALNLTAVEARVLGCLLEKSVITPDQYPLTLNALTNACNQKSSRSPVMSLEPGEVQQAARSLEAKHVVRCEENFRKQTEKYTQRLCNTPFSDYQFDPAQLAVICVLLLRGPRTPGEIRANSGRLHRFADNQDVVATLESLIEREGDPLVTMLARTPGRRDAEYAHLLGVDAPQVAAPPARRAALPEAAPDAAPHRPDDTDLASRVAQLEREVADLKDLVSGLRRSPAEEPDA